MHFYFPMYEMRERRGRGKSRNMNRELMGKGNRVGRAGETSREHGGTTVIEQYK